MTTFVIDLSTLTAAQGFAIQGDTAYDYAGRSVASAGDVNGDGIDDVIIGAYRGDDGGYASGEAYVIYGQSGATRGRLDLADLSAADGFVIQGDGERDSAGFSVAGAGDINGDGIDDLIVGAPFGDDGGYNAGEANVIYGRSGATRGRVDLADLSAADGFVIQGGTTNRNGDNAGRSVASAGDINGDGIDDLIIGAPEGSDGGLFAGEAYVIYGQRVQTRDRLDLTNLSAADGFVILGDEPFDLAGSSVASAGDVNGDGIDDLIIGAPQGADGGEDAGEAYVIFGQAGATRGRLDLTNLTAAEGFVIQGDATDDEFGYSVASAGDINGDGIDDLIVSAPGGDAGVGGGEDEDDDDRGPEGEAYVIYGQRVPTRDRIDLTNLTESDGFLIQGDGIGRSVDSAGDVNGDGIDDLIIGISGGRAGGRYSGEAYVIYGQSGTTRGTLDLANLAESDGVVVFGDARRDSFGFSVAGAGDVNNDGLDDLIVGARNGSDGGFRAGEAYVIYGFRTQAPLGAITDANAAADSVAETAAIGTLVGVTARAIDPDAGDTVTYALTDNAGGRFAINSTTGVVTVAGALDFETATSHQITVQATSSGGGSQSLAFTIQVQNVAEAVAGSVGKDRLVGTQADEVFAGGAGNDGMTGGGGNDIFVFGAETRNGVRETDQISDFRAGDLLDLGGATIVREINFGGSTRLILSDDGDQILLTGLIDFDPATMLLV